MIELDFISERLKTQSALVKKAQDAYNRYQVHINGTGTAEYLEKMSTYENQDQFYLRQKYAKSNRYLFSSLLRPIDKVFTSKGGSRNYNTKNKDVSQYISDVGGGFSLTKWLQHNWVNKFVSDPNGLIFVEVFNKEPYPTYKSIMSVHDYEVYGNNVEWVIFKHEDKNDGKYFRVVDDTSDRIVKWANDKAVIVDEIPNPFKKCPAFTCSDIPSPTSELKGSIVDDCLDLADEYLRDNSVHTIYKLLHGYPLFWMYVQDCPHCKGLGLIDGKTCKYCSGTGKDLRKDVSKIYGLEVPQQGDPTITPPAGYIQPDINSWTKQVEELEWFQRMMHFALWGTDMMQSPTERTATEVMFVNVHPVNERLTAISETAERLDQDLTNLIIGYYVQGYKGASINYGKRFLIENPDQILKRYEEGKKSGLPDAELNQMMEEYYETKYKNQPVQLAYSLKLLHILPAFHYTLEDLKDTVMFDVKLYSIDWVNSLTRDYIIQTGEKELKQQLNDYVQGQKVLRDQSGLGADPGGNPGI